MCCSLDSLFLSVDLICSHSFLFFCIIITLLFACSCTSFQWVIQLSMKLNLAVRLILSVPVWVITFFHFFGLYVFVMIFHKGLVEAGWFVVAICLLAVFLFLLSMSLWSLFQAYLSDPGEVSASFNEVRALSSSSPLFPWLTSESFVLVRNIWRC